jgi:hypothetical protein
LKPDPDAPQTILEALSHAAAGDHDRGLALIQPLVDAGPVSTYALLASLAEAICRMTADPQALDDVEQRGGFVMVVDGPDGPASAELLPKPLRFAGRFITCWANRDRETAWALFRAAANVSEQDGTDDLAEGVTAVFGMAVASTEAFVIERRRQREQQDGTA